MNKFYVLTSEIQAAMLFASNDDSRYVLQSVSFEVRPGRRPILAATNGRSLAVIESAAPQDDSQTSLPTCDVIISSAFLKPLCAFAKKESKLFPLSIDVHPPKRCIFQVGMTAVDCEDGSLIEGDFPKWRTLVPFAEKKEPLGELGINAEYMSDFAKAAKLLNNKPPCVRMNLYGESKVVEVRIDEVPNFYALIMPTKPTPVEWQPQFLGLNA